MLNQTAPAVAPRGLAEGYDVRREEDARRDERRQPTVGGVDSMMARLSLSRGAADVSRSPVADGQSEVGWTDLGMERWMDRWMVVVVVLVG